jgi:hypothetical protein
VKLCAISPRLNHMFRPAKIRVLLRKGNGLNYSVYAVNTGFLMDQSQLAFFMINGEVLTRGMKTVLRGVTY